MNNKLIIVDGHSSVGKSSISKSVHRQVSLQEAAYWLHEECENHPIRSGEFRFGRLDTPDGMEANRTGMLDKWKAFRDAILASGKVCVTEGCLLHAYDRYFIHSCWNESEILAYFSQAMDVMRDLDPVLVFLHRPDLRSSLEKAFLARGQWWRDLILRRDDLHVYFRDHTYENEDSMFAAVAFEQSMMIKFFDQLQCRKIKIDTSAEEWEDYVQDILAVCGLSYRPVAAFSCDVRPYIGRYRCQGGTENDDWIIDYDQAHDDLFTTLFWPYMPMRCLAEDRFELISFPVELHFSRAESGLQFIVRGNYEWEYNDHVFIKV